jgi:hypothetical protein
MELKDILYLLEKENPNDQEFGKKVRLLIWEMKKTQSAELAKEQLPGQIDMFGPEFKYPYNE